MPDLRPSGTSTCFIGGPSETDMPDQRLTCLVVDQHAWSETNMLGCRPTCLIRDRHACLIGDTSKTDMLNRRLIGDWHALLDFFHYSNININKQKVFKNKDFQINVFEFRLDSTGMSVSNGSQQAYWSPSKHVGLQWSMPRSSMGLRPGM